MKLNLPTLGEVNAQPHAPMKGLPPVLAKKERQKSKEKEGAEFRRKVWIRDHACSRATGKKVVRSGTTDWAQLGEVDHAYLRSTAPEAIYDVSNGILLSKEENRLRKVPCPRAPEYKLFDYSGPADRARPQKFVWRDKDGRITKTRMG